MARGRSSSSSSKWRYFQLSYYLKRPKRLALLFIGFVTVTFIVWDRQTLTREHEVEMSRLNEDLSRLQNQLLDLKSYLGDAGENLHFFDKMGHPTKKDLVHDDPIDVQRRDKVKEAMLHAWTSYEKYAWGQDELQPQTKSGVDSFGGLGATIVDSLDTLYIMGLDQQFQKAKEWVANSLDFNKNYDASVFETTIRLRYKAITALLHSMNSRVVGGLLSAYDLSGEKVFLEKARDIADRLLPAWDTPSGIPYNRINLAHGHAHNFGWTSGNSILADSGTEQLEFIALSQRTGDPKYQQKVENVITQLQKTFPNDGLLPIFISPHSGAASLHSTITFGAMGDSFYEYLLKVWIQGNKTEAVKHYREMWETSMQGLLSLIRKSTPSSFTYICEKEGNSLHDKMDELACFAPGMLALGSSGFDNENAAKFLQLAKELAWTCYNFYQSTPTKLAGENYFFRGQDMTVGTSWNILRPETVESLVYLWRITGNKTYQEWGWNIFQAFEKNSRIDSGYVGLKDVHTGVKDNMMQSFFLAETLKYLYLLFSPPSVVSFDEWVFNTEAHPLRITPRLSLGESSGGTRGEIKPPVRFFGRKEGRSGDRGR